MCTCSLTRGLTMCHLNVGKLGPRMCVNTLIEAFIMHFKGIHDVMKTMPSKLCPLESAITQDVPRVSQNSFLLFVLALRSPARHYILHYILFPPLMTFSVI